MAFYYFLNRRIELVYIGKLLDIPGVPSMRTPSSHMNGGSHHEFN